MGNDLWTWPKSPFRDGNPIFFILFVDHKLQVWDKANVDRCPFRTLDEPFLSHKHNGPILSCLSLEVNGEDPLEIYRGIKRP